MEGWLEGVPTVLAVATLHKTQVLRTVTVKGNTYRELIVPLPSGTPLHCDEGQCILKTSAAQVFSVNISGQQHQLDQLVLRLVLLATDRPSYGHLRKDRDRRGSASFRETRGHPMLFLVAQTFFLLVVATVIGVARDTDVGYVFGESHPVVYLPLTQRYDPFGSRSDSNNVAFPPS